MPDFSDVVETAANDVVGLLCGTTALAEGVSADVSKNEVFEPAGS